MISYSPLSIPLSGPSKSTTLIRRDLFDARFQLISEGTGDAVDDNAEETSKGGSGDLLAAKQALAFLDAPSDLVPGVYEGGLKTWECSLDLVDYLDQLKQSSNLTKYVGKRALEVCTAVSLGVISYNFTSLPGWMWYWSAIDVYPS